MSAIGRITYTAHGLARNYFRANMIPDDNCDFAYMTFAGTGYPAFIFGSYNEGATCNYNGTYGRDSYDENPFTDIVEATQVKVKADLVRFMENCRYYFVTHTGKLTNAKYDLLIEGVENWCDSVDFICYCNVIGIGINMFDTSAGFEVQTGGSEKLVKAGELAGQNFAKTVESEWITASNYQYYGTSNWVDSPEAYMTFDSIKKAKDAEFITDPDLISFINDDDWEEYSDTKCDWTVNIDGVKDPDITFAWSAPMIESGEVEGGNATVTLQIQRWSGALSHIETLGIYSYLDHTKKFSFSKLATEANIPAWSQFLQNIINDCEVVLYMYLTYFFPGGMQNTSIAQAVVTYKGRGSGQILPPRDGSTITFKYESTDEFISTFEDDIDTPDTPDGTSPESKQQTYSGIGVMTRTYVIDKGRLQQLGRKLWDYSFYDFIQNLNASPIENIVSIKMYPFNIPGGQDTEIVLGNVGMGVLGKPVDIDYNCKHVINPSGTTIAKKYPQKYNYLNSNVFTKLSIFLPYIGFKELDASVFLDHELKVEYIVDILTGSCVAMCYADDVPIVQYNGLMGLDIPISATNRAQVEAGIIQSVGQSAMQLAQKNIGGAASAALNILSQSYHTETQGTASPSCNSFITHDVFYILEAPEVQFPSGYAHSHGLPLFLTKSLNKVHGFTVCDNVDTSGIQGATLEEKEMIKQALEEGVYL